MIYGFVGTYDDVSNAGTLRGNGKTNGMVYYLYQDYIEENKTILTNFYTEFSQQMTTQEIIDMFFDEELELDNISIGIDEIQLILNSLGTKASVLKFMMRMVSQTRKRNTDVYYTTQRYYDIHLRMRVQTDVVIEPYKTHYELDDEGNIIILDKCYSDKCKKAHLIHIKCKKPYIKPALDILIPEEVGELYNTNEIINEEITITKTPKTKLKKEDEIPVLLPYNERKTIAQNMIKSGCKFTDLTSILSYNEMKKFQKEVVSSGN